MFLFPKGALTHHFVVAKSALRDPREAVVSLPLVGLVRSAEGYPLLQATPAMQPLQSASIRL